MDFTDEQKAWIGDNLARAVKQTARRCAEIAESAQGMRMHVEGAIAVATEIRREFGLGRKIESCPGEEHNGASRIQTAPPYSQPSENAAKPASQP